MPNSHLYQTLSSHFTISPDYFVVADGSGTTAATPCGYFAWLVPAAGPPEAVWGAASHGTNNHAELAPFLLALGRVAEAAAGAGRSVVCASDSEVTVRCARREYARKANRHLWAALDWFEQAGLALDWRWVRRNSIESHAAADANSRAARHAMEALLAEFPPEGGIRAVPVFVAGLPKEGSEAP